MSAENIKKLCFKCKTGDKFSNMKITAVASLFYNIGFDCGEGYYFLAFKDGVFSAGSGKSYFEAFDAPEITPDEAAVLIAEAGNADAKAAYYGLAVTAEQLAEAMADKPVDDITTLKQQLAEARAEIDSFNELVRQQHKRTMEASKLRQIAHNEPDTWPDLGVLIDWLSRRGDGDNDGGNK